jgi:hypothetical protein
VKSCANTYTTPVDRALPKSHTIARRLFLVSFQKSAMVVTNMSELSSSPSSNRYPPWGGELTASVLRVSMRAQSPLRVAISGAVVELLQDIFHGRRLPKDYLS